MRVLWVATYPDLGPSTRYRVTQFLPRLRELGVESTFVPLLSNAFYPRLYRPGGALEKSIVIGAKAIKRLKDALDARRYDAVVVQREACLIGPNYFERLVKFAARRPLVFDVDDAIFMLPPETERTSAHPLLARILKSPSKADRTAEIADEVIVSTGFLEGWAASIAKSVTVIPTVVDAELFRPKEIQNPRPVVGWIGTHSTAHDVEGLGPVLRRLARKHDFTLRLVGAGRDVAFAGVRVESLPWSLAREVDDYRDLDIGIAPLSDTAWARGKSGFKQRVYMACGKPQVSSPIGGVNAFLEADRTGLFASSHDEWHDALDRLLSDPRLCARMGLSAREAFLAGCHLETEAPRLHGVLTRAVERTR